MSEFAPQFNPEDFVHEKDDFTDVHNPEFQDELREAEQEEGKDEKEFELTPEIEAMVMEKVLDINRKGIGYHNSIELEPILKHGLLAGTASIRSDNPVAGWGKEIREYPTASELNFNITGRSIDVECAKVAYPDLVNKTDIYLSDYHAPYTYIFDMESFNELDKEEDKKTQ